MKRKEKKKKNEKRVIGSGTKILKTDKQGKVEAQPLSIPTMQ